jgi:hypothetical protein
MPHRQPFPANVIGQGTARTVILVAATILLLGLAYIYGAPPQ